MFRRLMFLTIGQCLSVLVALPLLTACGTPRPIAAPDDVTPTKRGAASQPATAAPPSPAAATATPSRGEADGPVSMSVNAVRAPLLHYRGRRYFGVFGGTPGSGPSTEWRPDRIIGETFSRWQSNGQFPPETPLYSVVGQPIEQVLAVQGERGPFFFRVQEQAPTPDSTQVALGTVTSFGPARWTTPDGRRPPGYPQARTDATIYTPATVAVERVLQGRIPANEREIEVRQWGGTDGQITASRSTGGIIPLTPGGRVILFLQPGQWSSGGHGSIPAGDYYLLWSEGAYAVEGDRVTPLGVGEADAGAVTLDDFLGGITETFQGVQPLDPHGPRPTPPPVPTPLPTPTPRFRTGQTVNLAGEYRLAEAESIFLKGLAVPEARREIIGPDRIGAVVASLDHPLPVAEVASLGPNTQPDYRRIITVIFRSAEGKNLVALDYDREVGTLIDRGD